MLPLLKLGFSFCQEEKCKIVVMAWLGLWNIREPYDEAF